MTPSRRGFVAGPALDGAGLDVAFRADIDALRMHDLKDVPYRSTREGVMHACGHDAHAAMAIGSMSRKASRRCSHQRRNWATAWAWAARVLGFSMLAEKNSRKRRAAESRASATMAGTVSNSPVGRRTISPLTMLMLPCRRPRQVE
jgi:metal-dependent amidase/aminoacylase/carboxypeptidase family protein